MYNLRYHIASLVGVFLALALGLILGGLVVERGGMQSQEDSLIEGLQREFSSLRRENADLTEQNELMSAFSKDVVDTWAPGRLEGKTYVLVSAAGRSDGLAAVTEAIESAGGTVAVATMTETRFGLDDRAVRSEVTSLASNPDDVEASVVASLAAEWTGGSDTWTMTEALSEAGVLSLKGFDERPVFAGLVDLAARANKPDEHGLALAEAFAVTGGVAVAGQTTSAGNGVAAAGAERGLGALDTLGTEVGRYTLISLLSGAKSGYYGLAEQAVSGHPPYEGR